MQILFSTADRRHKNILKIVLIQKMSGYDEGQKEADLRNELSTCLTSHWRYCMAGVLSGEWTTTTTTTTTSESSCFVSNCSFRFVWNEIFFFFFYFFLFLPRLVYSFLLHQMNFTTDFSLTFSSSSCSHCSRSSSLVNVWNYKTKVFQLA